MLELKGLMRGLGAYFQVIPLFSKLGLWRYVLLTAAIALGLLLVLVPVAIILGRLVYGLIATTLLKQLQEWSALSQSLVIAVIILALLVVFALVYKHLLLVATAPWMSAVAARVTSHVQAGKGVHRLGSDDADQEHETATWQRSIRLNLRLLTKELMYTLPLIVVGFIPGVNLLGAVALLAVQSFYVGVGSLDYAVERRYAYRPSIAFYNAHKGLAAGVGAGFVALMATGVGVLLAPAWSAAAGAYAYAMDASRKQQD